MVNATTVADVVAQVEEKVKTKTAFMRLAVVDAESIMARATTAEIKAETKKVYEALRYSDPMSSDMLASIEQEIDINLKEWKLESEYEFEGFSHEKITRKIYIRGN